MLKYYVKFLTEMQLLYAPHFAYVAGTLTGTPSKGVHRRDFIVFGSLKVFNKSMLSSMLFVVIQKSSWDITDRIAKTV